MVFIVTPVVSGIVVSVCQFLFLVLPFFSSLFLSLLVLVVTVAAVVVAAVSPPA